jgi:hypothetical protein
MWSFTSWFSISLEFFAIGHGKGKVDGVKALLKQEVKKE